MSQIQDENEDVEETDLEDVVMPTAGGLLRPNSVMISQWGLEHNLKLRETGEDTALVEGDGEEEARRRASVPELSMSHDVNEPVRVEDLPLPSTPNRTEKSLSEAKVSKSLCVTMYNYCHCVTTCEMTYV